MTSIVLVHLMSFFVLLNWNDPRSLLGESNYILNRYYSTKTMHVHKLNHQNPLLPKNAVGAIVRSAFSNPEPMHWDALGLIIPATDEDAKIHQYKIETTRMIHRNTTCSGQGLSCFLENNAGSYLLLNGESLSVLSEISSSVYFATLLVIYLLSSLPLVFRLGWKAFYEDGKQQVPEDRILLATKIARIVILIIYFAGLVNAYTGSPFTKVTNLKIQEVVYYSTSSHMASILVCVVTLFFYLVHLRGSHLQYHILGSETHAAVAVSEETSILVQGSTPRPDDQPKQQAQIVDTNGYKGKLAEETKTFFSSCFAALPGFMDFDKYLDTLDFDISKGPYSSEVSIIIAVTIFLGGMGNLGLTRGVVLEIEAQFVLACVLGFAVLEVASYRLEAYCIYLFSVALDTCKNWAEHDKQMKIEREKLNGVNFGDTENHLIAQQQDPITSKLKETLGEAHKDFFTGVCFIRFVILLLQFWILVLYDATISEIGYTYSDCERAVFVLVVIYFTIQVLLLWTRLFSGVFQRITCGWEFVFPASEQKAGDFSQDYRWWREMLVELAFFVVAFLVIFSVLFHYATVGRNHAEDRLEHYEKMQYSKTYDAVQNPNCAFSGKYKTIGLMNEEIHDSKIRDWEKRHSWVNTRVDPVDLKVFFWTKHWNIDPRSHMVTSKLFCKNGFEHHWMSCRNDEYLQPSTKTNEAIAKKYVTFDT